MATSGLCANSANSAVGAGATRAFRQPQGTRNRRSRCRAEATAAFQQKDCRDMVNQRKEVEATGSIIVTFMGAEGSSVAVECPKVFN